MLSIYSIIYFLFGYIIVLVFNLCKTIFFYKVIVISTVVILFVQNTILL